MVGLGILLLVIGGIFVLCAMNGRLLFWMEEGWKFRDNPEPSELYISGTKLGYGVLAIASFIFGVVLIVQGVNGPSEEKVSPRVERQQQREHRCREVTEEVRSTTRFDDKTGVVTNPDEVKALAADLGLDVTIETAYVGTEAQTVTLTDPKLDDAQVLLLSQAYVSPCS